MSFSEESRRRAALAAVLVTVALAAGCAPPSRTAPEPVAAPVIPPKGTVVFDMGHGEIFGAEDTTELGQSQAIQRMRDAGFEVVINPDTITDSDLEGASGLVIAGPMRPLLDEEYDTITSFAEKGGTVLLTIHVPYPVLKVPAHWGLPVGTEIMMSERPLAEPSVFVAYVIEESPITEGVQSVAVFSGWPVGVASKDGSLVVRTGDDTWLAASGDNTPQTAEKPALASYGVIGVTSVGRGRIVVSGDDAIFANMALGAAHNARLLDNIIELMSEATEL